MNFKGSVLRKSWKKTILFFLILSFVLLPVLDCQASNLGYSGDSIKANDSVSGDVIRVGWYDCGEDADAHEYDYEYLQALAQYTGWTYEYVEGSWEECLTWLEQGEIDLLGFVQKTPERDLIYGYPSLPMIISSGYLVTGVNGTLQSADPLSITGHNVGLVEGNGFNHYFLDYCNKNSISVNIVQYPSMTDIPVALANGEISAAVVAEEDRTPDEEILMRLTSESQYFVTDIDDHELLEELDAAMMDLNTYYPDFNTELYHKYFSVNDNGKPEFTPEEQEYIKNNPNIPVLFDAGWPPIEYWDEETGTYVGISPDIFSLLSEKCGINFVYEGSTSGEILDSLMEGEERNALTTISYDYKWAEQHDVYITQPFISSGIVKLGKNLNTENPIVAVNDKAYFTYLLASELEGITILNYGKQVERLDAVRTGVADYTFVTEDQANYYRSIPKYSNLEVEKMIGYEQAICISVSRDCDPELLAIISKSLASITHDEMTAIITKNTIDSYQWTTLDYLYAYRIPLILLAIILTVIIVFSILLSNSKKKNTAKLQEAYEKEKEFLIIAENASRAKGDFMSRMSHEIRTPLNAIIGYNTIARNEVNGSKTDEERRQAEMKVMDCLTKSEIASKHLLTIINDVLDMSAIESGKIKISKERFDFKGLINSVTTVFYSQAKSRGVNLDVVFDNLTEEWFIGDQLRVNQVLTNLLSNAIKFTPEGGSVRLSICQPEVEVNASHIHFEVSDTGIGMSKEAIEHLWEPFEQADSSIARRFGGTGLGMTITKNLVELMEGSISVDSTIGKGTTFKVDLTFGQAEQSKHSEHYNFNNINALFVDDDANTCDYVKLLFDRCGARCTTVTSGMDAIEAVNMSKKQREEYSICLVDWQMPAMDGIETIQRIREIAGDDLPVIVITAYDYSEIADSAKKVGVNMFISKPLFQSSLFDLLVDISGEENSNVAINSREEADYHGARVLLAEDNKMNMEIARKLLEYSNLKVDIAWNGVEVKDKLLQSEPGTYKAIFMDVRMPIMDGIEATEQIRNSKHPDALTIPIIAMTADAFAENVASVMNAGMNDHIAKPIEMNILQDKLNKYLKN